MESGRAVPSLYVQGNVLAFRNLGHYKLSSKSSFGVWSETPPWTLPRPFQNKKTVLCALHIAKTQKPESPLMIDPREFSRTQICVQNLVDHARKENRINSFCVFHFPFVFSIDGEDGRLLRDHCRHKRQGFMLRVIPGHKEPESNPSVAQKRFRPTCRFKVDLAATFVVFPFRQRTRNLQAGGGGGGRLAVLFFMFLRQTGKAEISKSKTQTIAPRFFFLEVLWGPYTELGKAS